MQVQWQFSRSRKKLILELVKTISSIQNIPINIYIYFNYIS